MSLLALVLILASALLHATWNYWGKRDQPSIAFFWIANLTSLAVLSPLALSSLDELLSLPTRLWLLAIASGACLALYFCALATSYRLGELTVAYPLARSSPILVVLVVTLILGQGEQLGWGVWTGSFLIVVGCIFVPLEQLSEFSWRCYFCASCGFAFVAACGTAGYSVIDDEALRLWREWSAASSGWNSIRRVLLYSALQTAACAVWLTLPLLAVRSERARLAQVWSPRRPRAHLAGIVIVATYALVLGSMQFVDNVSYVVAFRQLSIPIGVAFGACLLGERVAPVRWVGVAILVVGLGLVAVG